MSGPEAALEPSRDPEPWNALDRGVAVAIAVAAVAVGGAHLLAGAGYVLDDWYTLAHGQFDGAWGAAGPDQSLARPGAAAVYALVFGLVGERPAVALVLQVAAFALTATLLYLLLRRWFPRPLAVIATVLWVVLPNHVTLERWASATNITVALGLVMLGALLVSERAPSTGRQAAALVCFAASVLCYEATLPVAAVACVAIPWLQTGRVDRRFVAAGAAALGAVALWMVVNWHPAKTLGDEVEVLDPAQVLQGHFGWGIWSRGPASDALALGVVVGVIMLAYTSRRSLVSRPEGRALLAGLAILVLGTLPFLAYFYSPLGAGDRVTVVSGVGGALVLASLVVAVGRRRIVMGGALFGALVLGGLVARWDRTVLWGHAGSDGRTILAEIERRWPEGVLGDGIVQSPDGVVLGPAPIQVDNVVTFLDSSNIASAVRLRYSDETLALYVAQTAEDFASVPPELQLDIRPLTSLSAD